MVASEPRERLARFVGGVVRPRAHVRQRRSALLLLLLHAQGLIEHRGRSEYPADVVSLREVTAAV